MDYFDLHCHPTFKYSLLSASAQERIKIDQPFEIRFKGAKEIIRGAVLWTLGDPIGAQSCLTQLAEGQARIISHTLMALENAYTKSSVISQLQCVSNDLDIAKIDQIKTGAVGYWDSTLAQLEALRNIADGTTPVSPAAPRLRIIHDMADFRPGEVGTQFVILNLEGGHCFYKGQSNDDPDLEKNVLDHLIGMKRQGIRPLYITLVHHAQNAFANHAFAVPSRWAGAGTNDDGIGGFNPTGEGITPLGERFIREALSEQNGPPIYIDVKHMSLGSRIAYYEFRRKNFPHIPIIASHMGVTGVSWNVTHFDGKPIVRWVRRRSDVSPVAPGEDFIEVKYNNLISFPKNIPPLSPANPVPTSVVTFNPWSINLYDEDIVEILESGGLIGLSLDVRILGMGNSGQVAHEHEPERLSLNEQLFSVHKHLATGQNDFDALPDNRIQASLLHVEYLCNNLLHVVKIGRAVVGERVWDHLCIGSDFDGLVVAIEFRNNRRTHASNIPELREQIRKALPVVARKMGIPLVGAGQPVEPFIEKVLNGLFFDNALQFLNKFFRKDPGPGPVV